MLRIGASSGAQVSRTIAEMPSGPLDLEVSSWKRAWRTFRVKNLIGDIVNLKGESGVVGPLSRPGFSWRQRLTKKDRPEGVV